ncbi:type II toxin-antitoxin system VapB family antitoxin [Candidatus Bipolaricaulota bacterium]|nr:type II toxin-antitoxin system VapB family antitoxin [Candidatus Bipolaricaulota bacterium]
MASKERVKDKHLKLDQEVLDQARRILGAKTERETVERALDMVVSEARLERLLRELKGKGTLKKVFT